MQAPQSQVLSSVQGRDAQPCGAVEPALQSVLTGHLKAPPTHDTAVQPFEVALGPGAQVYPSGHLKASVSQRAVAQPWVSAPARVGAQVSPLGHVYPAPQGVGPQRPLAMSHVMPGSHDVLVHRFTQTFPTNPPTQPQDPPAAVTQIWSAAQPPSPKHCGPGSVGMPPPPHGYCRGLGSHV